MNSLRIVLATYFLVSVSSETLKSVGDCIWQGTELQLDLSNFQYFAFYDSFSYASYRYYPCKATEDWGLYDCLKDEGPALCQQNSDGSIYVVGDLETAVFREVTPDTFELSYKGGYLGREGKVTITCSQSSDNFQFDSETFPTYYFSLSVKTACTNKPAGLNGDDGGFALFLILLFASLIGVSAYIGGGVAFMYFHKKERGLGLIPNLAFWKDFPFLFRDGFLFTFSCIPKVREYMQSKVSGGNYEKMPGSV